MSTVNPYAPPRAHVEDFSGASSGEEAVRREHIKHEAAVRSIGTLYYLGGALGLLSGAAMLSGAMNTGTEADQFLTPVGVIYLVFGAVSIAVAWGLRRLRNWARIATIVLSVISLLGFPVGTLISAYILYLLLSAKGQRIFAPDYAAIVAATPHVKYRTSIVVWIAVGLLVLVLLAIVAAAALGT